MKPVEKIHVEFDIHSSKLSMSAQQGLDTVRDTRVRPQPLNLMLL